MAERARGALPTDRRRATIVWLVLLGVQSALFAYSFTDRARSMFSLNGTDTADRFGVTGGHWAYLHINDNGGYTPDVAPSGFNSGLGIRYARLPYVLWAVAVHFVWTLAPTVLIAALLVRNQLRLRHTRRRRAAGLCGACGYDLRMSADTCPECGATIDAGLRETINRLNDRRDVAAMPAPTGC